MFLQEGHFDFTNPKNGGMYPLNVFIGLLVAISVDLRFLVLINCQ